MKIHSLTLHNVRAIEHLELTDIPDTGVILIHGENEAGKSTILDALDAVLNFKHSSSDSRIRALRPAGKDVEVEVALEATVGPYTFTVQKRFLRGRRSSLTITAPRREQYTGREADDKLAAILDEHLDQALASTLFLRQGQLSPGVKAAGIPSITRALDQGGEEDAGAAGTDDTALMQRIETEFARYFTKTGKKAASYAALEKQVDAARDRLADLRGDVARLSGFVDEVARREAEIAAIQQELPDAEREEAARAEEAAAARALAQQAAAAAKEEQRAGVDLERAEADVRARAEARERVATLEKAADELSAQLDSAREAAETEAGRIAELTALRDDAKRNAAAAREAVRQAERARQGVRVRAHAEALAASVASLDAVDAELAGLRARQPERPVTDADVRALEKAREEVALQRRLRDAASAKIEVSGPEGARVLVDGTGVEFPGSAVLPVHDRTRVTLGDFDVVYRAAHGADDSSADPSARLEAAERELGQVLEELACADIDEARRLRDEHAELASALDAARRQREEILGGRDADDLRADHTRAEAQAQEAGAGETSEDAAEEELSRAQSALDDAEEAAERAEAALKPWAERKEATALAVAEAKAESKAAEYASAREEWAAAERTTPGLVQARDAAAAAHAEAAAESAKLAGELAAANPELASDLYAGAQTRLRNLRSRQVEADKRIAELTGRIEQASGVAEQADRAEAECDAAEFALATARRRADAVSLLRETMLRHREAARARYAAPFAEALNRYASRVFGPDVEFTLGESLEIEARTLNGATVALDQLSGGAQEQLALLVRFAIAELAGSSPVPVIVDDALGATDPARLALMNSLFNQVGKHSQVFVLTCFPQRFDRVEAAKVAHINELAGGEK
ncbi:DNA repair exonuclease SbcCD ATPase subunit [Corynebacterium mycetoides]|uniref:DNA repair exonuclease SbcCD ATPase subunit n=1 Tax=Corynebacterium mycetoides TaxID=38302 RepID=A0A1G9LUZ5_9CORY|nr:AAA family ATPase [Corynebacterium mycetoides]SDL65733.1 DNA repair exonuclease SbcCD ATPase subunit [Corynebacterium mycetoides]